MDKQCYFEELAVPDEPSCLILLDIDGTLVPDIIEVTSIESAVKEKVAQLSKHHTVYLCTNGEDRDRAQNIASMLGIGIISNGHKKYSRKILSDLPLNQNRQVLVIGDKILTDGLLARNLGAQLYLVKRKLSGKERFPVRLGNYLDDMARAILS